ncbi:MAG: hypothetical protein JXA89_15550 [Anaerolineae bacterium]|nr:hypothetical protein [Anaerolineae bacterium]
MPSQTVIQDRYQGFSLRSVCWGYRDVFAQAIERLFIEGVLGPQQESVTAHFFTLLKLADQQGFDHVLRQFIGALRPENRWMMQLPGIFADLTELGASLGQARLYHGTRYFELLGGSGFGDTPQQVRQCLTWMRRLRESDGDDLAMAFLAGYRRLLERLTGHEIELYVQEASRVYQKRGETGLKFMRGELASAEVYVGYLSQECRLSDIVLTLKMMLRALASADVEIGDLGALDSDDLLMRGTRVVCLREHLYLPLRFREFDRVEVNRRWYLLLGIVAAGMLAGKSFALIHGYGQFESCADLVGHDVLALNLFQVIEIARVLRHIHRQWPGARRLVAWGLAVSFNMPVPLGPAEALLRDVMDDRVQTEVVQAVRVMADGLVNCFDTASCLVNLCTATVRGENRLVVAYAGLNQIPMHPLPFLSDFGFPISVASPPQDSVIADLETEAQRKDKRDVERNHAHNVSDDNSDGDHPPGDDAQGGGGIAVCYVYDEWNYQENDYFHNYCLLYESYPEVCTDLCPAPDLVEQANKVRAVFERLKPDLAHREKYLSDGDGINFDLLLDYVVQQKKEPSPPVRFYEKPLINRRDLAVLILLDVSGSTGSDLGGGKVIDIEKQAGIILGQGLDMLGDRFSICGFTSNGREDCTYWVYKSFDESWSREAISRILAAWPSHSTRIGPALRHSGYRLSLQPNRQKLIILVTDGKPMDRDYDPKTRYAQHDVRMACEENARRDVHTFAISTEENSQADMEIMFPRKRFAILSDIRDLPRVLPRLYVNLTT